MWEVDADLPAQSSYAVAKTERERLIVSQISLFLGGVCGEDESLSGPCRSAFRTAAAMVVDIWLEGKTLKKIFRDLRKRRGRPS